MRGKFFALLILSTLSSWADIRLTEPGQPVVIGGKGVVFSEKPFSPADLPGLAAWYSADFGVLTSVSPDVPATEGQTVRRWLDRSGNGRHLDQTVLANQPVLTAASTLPSGFPAVTADGATSLLQVVFPDAIIQPFTIFILNRRTGGAGNFTLYRQNGSGTSAVAYGSPWSVFAGSVVPTSVANTSWHTFGHQFSGADSFVSDGATFTTTNPGTAGLISAAATFNVFGNGANFWGGNISEFLIYTGPMSQTDAGKVLRYLRRRGGL